MFIELFFELCAKLFGNLAAKSLSMYLICDIDKVEEVVQGLDPSDHFLIAELFQR